MTEEQQPLLINNTTSPDDNSGATAGAPPLRTYSGAVAIVTGAASGIGRALAEELAEKGARAIVLADRQLALAEEVAVSLRRGTTETKAYEVDVRTYVDVERVVAETKSAYGRLDYIFNNAGTAVAGPMEEIGVDDFDYVLDVNVRGVANGVHAAYPIMKEQGYGHIVNTSSFTGLLPMGEGWAAYGTSKYAVVGLSMNLRVEAARHGVHVSVLCPGFIKTGLLKGGGEYGKSLSAVPQEKSDEFVEKVLRPMEPKLFAAEALKLVAHNKAVIIVPGGMYKMLWWLNRLSPSLGLYIARKVSDGVVKENERILKEQAESKNKKD